MPRQLPSILVAALVLTSLALRLSLALGPLANIDGVCMPDDTYLFLDIARSIANGDGPLYGREHTNGFQPLFAFVLAPIFWFCDGGDTPVHTALVILSVIDTLALLALLGLAGRLCDQRWPIRVVLATAWVCNHNVIRNTLNGMETALALLLIVVALRAHLPAFRERAIAWSKGKAAAVGATLGLAMLTRVDSILLGGAIGLWVAWRLARRQLTIAAPLATLAAYAVGAITAFAPWIIYSLSYTGELYPVSGRAVRLQADAHYELFPNIEDPIWIHLRRAAGEIYRGNFPLLVALVALTAFVLVRPAARRSLIARTPALAPLALHATLLFVAYAAYIHGTWFFHRYLYPVIVPIAMTVCVALDAVLGTLAMRTRWVLVSCTALALLAGSTSTREFDELMQTRSGNFGYRPIGLWVDQRFEPGTVIGAKQSGAIGYYADDCVVLNLDGVVNRSALDALEAGRMMRYIEEQGIEYLVMWDWGSTYLRHFSRQPLARDLHQVEAVPEIHSWGDVGTNQWLVYELR